MKKPRLSSYFTPDELDTILMQIDLHNLNGVPQNENLQFCFVSKRIAGHQGKKVTKCKNCHQCTPTLRMYKLTW